jgi:hypothetical protein
VVYVVYSVVYCIRYTVSDPLLIYINPMYIIVSCASIPQHHRHTRPDQTLGAMMVLVSYPIALD